MKKHFAKQIFAAALAISFVCGLSACREREEEQLSLKPVIYLYPEEETDVSVTLAYDGTLTCTYPNYKTGWHVSAKPDGTLTDEDGQRITTCTGKARTARNTTFPAASA